MVVDCQECHRTIWANSVCHHGQVPPPSKDAPVEDAQKPLKGGVDNRGRKL